MRLTFFGLTPLKIELSHKLIPLIKKRIGEMENGSTLSDITDVIPNSEKFKIGDFIRFSVFLFEEYPQKTNSSARRGILIGHSKDEGMLLIGIWPYNWFQQLNKKLSDAIKEIFQILTNSKNISNLLYIIQK